MPHTEVHGTVTGTEDGKHAKADTELGEIALKNKLFFVVVANVMRCFQAYHQMVKNGEGKREKDRIAVRMLRSRDQWPAMMYPVSRPDKSMSFKFPSVVYVEGGTFALRWTVRGTPTKQLT